MHLSSPWLILSACWHLCLFSHTSHTLVSVGCRDEALLSSVCASKVIENFSTEIEWVHYVFVPAIAFCFQTVLLFVENIKKKNKKSNSYSYSHSYSPRLRDELTRLMVTGQGFRVQEFTEQDIECISLWSWWSKIRLSASSQTKFWPEI